MELINKSATDRAHDIQFKQLTVWTSERSWWRKLESSNKPRNIILDNVTGTIRQGEFVAILGPSGAGKTTFLVCLAGKCTLPSNGSVTINGTNINELQIGQVEIIPQHDVFIDSLTVLEHLVFMVEIKLGKYKKARNKSIVNKLINDLQLKPHLDKLIGILSGGERRLLSLAGSLISSPKIVVCDEPTTGLDSHNALTVIQVLKRLCSSGKTVICSVHQPSSELYSEFNSIMLMTEGKLLFHGDHKECNDLFYSFNLCCPRNSNPAEYYIKVISSNTTAYQRQEFLEKMSETYNQQVNITWKDEEIVQSSPQSISRFRRNWFKQVSLLVWRSSLTMKRDLRRHLVQMFMCIILPAIFLSIGFTGVSGATQRGVQDIRGYLWLMTSEISFNLSYAALYAFEDHLALYKRESSLYSASAFFASRFVNFIPRCIIWPVVSLAITTRAVLIPNHLETTLKMAGVLVYTAIAGTAYGLGMGAMFISTGITADVMPSVDLLLLLMSGAFLRISSTRLWLLPLRFLSHFYYGMDALSNVYWRQVDYIECPSNSSGGCLENGLSVLQEVGYSDNFVMEDSLGFLLLIVFWSVIGYIGLKREEKKGYAY